MNFLENHINWPNVKKICEKIKNKGFSILVVGGAVRDSLLKKEFQDFDLATDAPFEVLKEIFPRGRLVGESFGVMKLSEGPLSEVDLSIFRKDGPYEDGRHPESITPSSYEEDVFRRDFTINALSYDPFSKKIYDLTTGKKDLSHKIIQTVGKAELRFEEDKLRALRALRFSSQLGFFIEQATFRALYEVSLHEISKERIRDEFQKLLLASHSLRGLEDLKTLKFFKYISPHLSLHIDQDHFNFNKKWFQMKKVFLSYKKSSPSEAPSNKQDLSLTLSLMFHSLNLSEKEVAEDLKFLKFPNLIQKRVLFILNSTQRFQNLTKPEKLELLNHTDGVFLLRFLELIHYPSLSSLLDTFKNLMDKTGKLPLCFLTGDDLKRQGITPGPLFQKLLKKCLFLQWEGELKSYQDACHWLEMELKKN